MSLDEPIAGPSDQRRARHVTRVLFRNLTYGRHEASVPVPTRTAAVDDADAEVEVTRRRRALGARRVTLTSVHTLSSQSESSPIRPSRARTASSASASTLRRPRGASVSSVASAPTSSKLLETILVISDPHGQILHVSTVHTPSRNPSFDLDSLPSSSDTLRIELWAQDEGSWTLLLQSDLPLRTLRPVGREPVEFGKILSPNAVVVQLASGDYFAAPVDAATTTTDDEDPGALSDPGPSSATHDLLMRKRRIEEARRTDRKRMKEAQTRSLRETQMRTSESLEAIERIVELESSLRGDRVESEDLLRRLGELLERTDSAVGLHKTLEQARLAADRARRETDVHGLVLQDAADELARRRAAINERRQRLQSAQAYLATQQHAYAKLERRTAVDEHAFSLLQRALGERRAELVTTLDRILPIRAEPDSMLSFTILDLRSSDASALGYITLAVSLLAAYHHIALQQPLAFRGSRSLVQDRGVWYPLYEDGVERYRHEYARFLLNKNIEQLCRARDLEVPDLRQTLPNLFNFVLASTTLAVGDTSDDDTATTSSDSPPRPPSVRSSHSASSSRTVTQAAEKLRALRV